MDIQYRIQRWRYGGKGSGAECSFDYLSVLGVFSVLFLYNSLLIIGFTLAYEICVGNCERRDSKKSERSVFRKLARSEVFVFK